MKLRSQKYGLHRFGVFLVVAMMAGVAPLSSLKAQEADEETLLKDEVKIEASTDSKLQTERPTLEGEDKGPELKGTAFVQSKKFESTKKIDEMIVYLKDLMGTLPAGSDQRAEAVFNLAEAYWDKSRAYEFDAFAKQDECYAIKDAKRKQICKRQMQDMLDESKRLRKETIGLYTELINNYPNFKALDRVFFYLGSNLMEVKRQDEALEIYRRLIADFPDSAYVPNVLTAFGDYYFDEGQVSDALKAFKKAATYKEADVYPYALYKQGWCYFNMDKKERALDSFLETINAAKKRSDLPNSGPMIRQAQKDIVLTYSFVGTPDKALRFFRKLSGDEEEALSMGERLAVLYSDKGMFTDSSKMYRELILENKESVKTVDYQYEIVRNQLSNNAYDKAAVEELIRLMKLVQYADQGKFKDIDPKEYATTKARVEEQCRQWATTYHREAQKTKNPVLFAMAYNLYKEYLPTFGTKDNEHAYTMTFYFGELLFKAEKWKEAAEAYEKVMELDPKGKFTEDVVHGTVLAYMNLIDRKEVKVDLKTTVVERKESGEGDKDKARQGDQEKVKPPEPKEIPELEGRLVEACQRYSKFAPKGEHIVNVKYARAYVLYEYQHLKEAAGGFEDIAFNHSQHELAEVSARLHFDSLFQLQDLDAMESVALAYLEKKPIKDEAFVQETAELYENIRYNKCVIFDEKEQWKKGAECYVRFYRDFSDADRVDEALYNAALDFERLKDIGKAIKVRKFLLQATPQSELADETLFNIGANYHALAVYSQAARFYEIFVKNFPDHDKAEEALSNASTFRYGLGQYDRAILINSKYIELFGKNNKERAATAYFQIGEIKEKQGKKKDAFEHYQDYIKKYARKGNNDELFQARIKVAMHYWNAGGKRNRARALSEFKTILKLYERLSKDEKEDMRAGRDAAAQAQFMLGENVFEEMASIDINSRNEKELQKRLIKKRETGQEAVKIFKEVVKMGRPDWSIAAVYRIGAGFQNMANTIRGSKCPKRLSYDQCEIYKGKLEDFAMQFEETAVKHFEDALTIARETNWFNDYSRRAEIALAELRPKEYRKPSELRAAPVYFDAGFTHAKFVTTVKEEDRLSDFTSSEAAEDSGEPEGSEAKPEPVAEQVQ